MKWEILTSWEVDKFAWERGLLSIVKAKRQVRVMMTIGSDEVRRMFCAVSRRIVEMEPYLTEIDNKVGDGDHGIGMKIGFSRVEKVLTEGRYATVNQVFREIGYTLLKVMGGASGVLFGTMFVSGIVGMEEKERFGMEDFGRLFQKSARALTERGKAKVGDKTMMDALIPAAKAMEESAHLPLEEGFLRVAEEAKKGMEYTKECVAAFGRARYYKEKAMGCQDAGATSVYLIFQTMADWAAQYAKRSREEVL